MDKLNIYIYIYKTIHSIYKGQYTNLVHNETLTGILVWVWYRIAFILIMETTRIKFVSVYIKHVLILLCI